MGFAGDLVVGVGHGTWKTGHASMENSSYFFTRLKNRISRRVDSYTYIILHREKIMNRPL